MQRIQMEARLAKRRSGRRRPVRALAAMCLLLRLASAGWAQSRPSEYQVKAAYLFNFGKFVRSAGDGPLAKGPTFDICILGRDPMGASLDQIVAGDSIENHPVRVLRLTDPSQARSCAVVFLSSSESGSLREDLAILTGWNVLTVSDLPDFLERGGMIQFVLMGDHVRFDVNLDAVSRGHLVLSSELLRVAAAIKGMPGGAR
ncbi:MAG: YfiR family protein [Acidobacteriota bacterium]